MKRILPIAAALVLVLAGCSSAKEEAKETKKEEPVAVEETATEEEATEEAPADEGTTVNWTTAASADEAAKGAGFDRFGVLDKFVIGDLEFSNPSFAYAGGVAQATYETPATQVVVRKAVDAYETPLSDRELDSFAARWHKVIEGTDVACYGVAKGAVTVATWTDGVKSYAVTFQGLGGEEMSMDVEELATIVKGINEANADQQVQPQQEEAKPEEKKEEAAPAKSTLLSAENAEALVEKQCGGECISIDLVNTNQYGDCWYAVAKDADGATYEYYVNNDGVYLISKTEAPKQQEQQSQQQNQSNNEQAQPAGEHYEGEPVSIYDSVYAEWHQANDGQWYATFTTYNGTQIFAQTAPAGGGWVFYALDGGNMVQVIYSDQESSVDGEVGPGGVSSHWQALDGSGWY